MIDKLYRLNCEFAPVEHNIREHAAVASENHDMNLWHQRLGHLCEQQLRYMAKIELVTGIKLTKANKLSYCEACVEGKM